MKRPAVFSQIALIALFAGCAGHPTCPTDSVEPVSACRAEMACGKGGAELTLATLFAGIPSQARREGNAAIEAYDACVRRNIADQRAIASMPDPGPGCQGRSTASSHQGP